MARDKMENFHPGCRDVGNSLTKNSLYLCNITTGLDWIRFDVSTNTLLAVLLIVHEPYLSKCETPADLLTGPGRAGSYHLIQG